MQKYTRQASETLIRLLTAMAALFARRRQTFAGSAFSALPAPTLLRRPRPEETVSIPVLEQTRDDIACREAQLQGQFLARQDRWSELGRAMRDADTQCQATPGGMPLAEILSYGARGDVIHAVEHALIDGRPAKDAPLLEGIMGLEAVRRETAPDPYIDLVVAQAHIDIAWAWRGNQCESVVPKAYRNRCAAHFDRAAVLLEPHCGPDNASPAMAAAQCALLAGQRDPHARIADDYERLIDLDPGNHRHMRALGNHLLPTWFGSYRQLELEARRTAARTMDTWGAGGYTWVCFDAIAVDEEACALVDTEYFIDGIRDIVARRPEQEMINLLAAYCAVAMRHNMGGNVAADLQRIQIVDCANWLIRDHLTEIHPLIWAHATDGFDTNTRVTSLSRFAARGRANALQVIADLFCDDIDSGLHVTFTAEGPQLGPV